ncbi:MAG: bifunctional diaminohydroxyphosphoribosylaminopyrimidine deaminase/5-amino-6-(5-phosphoribosylamino)uracil reductase RibD [Gammaproteobacteria bacterium]|nr:bifunctional diaminohydroxyphosphoribosylaminopyrimidine deaminase/5-amino-6-(5-phosphoribosylamino)uracil reductase RibD [Gammaproteobacteria bacterium]
MSLALQLAKRGEYSVSPNPMVGCVIVKNNNVIAEGWHQQAGGPHAEINALAAAGSESRGATAYVTLEPCCHYGKTPPCTLALIKAGIKKVIIACVDPNPIISGRGIAELIAAGIEVEVGLLEEDALTLNEIFCHYIRYNRPYVYAKWAMSLDGKTISHPSDTKQITNEKSQAYVHDIRHRVDAIIIGANTARVDNPQLTVRNTDKTIFKQPLRIVISNSLNLSFDLAMFNSPHSMIVTTKIPQMDFKNKCEDKGIIVLTTKQDKDGLVDLNELLNELGKRKITSVLLEGGMQTHQRFLNEDLVNKVQVFLAPVLIGSFSKKKRFINVALNSMGAETVFSVDTNRGNYV